MAVPVTVALNMRVLCVSVVGTVIAGEFRIGIAGRLVCSAHSTATVRVFRLAGWLTTGVVRPDNVFSAQALVPVGLPLTVMVRVAVAVPELVKSEVPAVLGLEQPECLSKLIVVAVPVKLGSTRTILSFTAIDVGVVKAYVMAVAEALVVTESVRMSDPMVHD